MGEDEAGTRARFNAHLYELIEPAIASRRGRIVKTTGDGLLVEFSSVVRSASFWRDAHLSIVDPLPRLTACTNVVRPIQLPSAKLKHKDF